MATISTVLRLVDNVSNPLKNVRGSLDQTTRGFESLAGKIVSVNSAIQLFSVAANSIRRLGNMMNQYVGAYQLQIENETKLETVMRKRMGATQEKIESIKELAKIEQQRGVYGDEMILQGAQELATYVNDKKVLNELIPAMGHLLAQQRGMNAGLQDMQSVATMMGKVMGGQLAGLSRIGYVFSEDEKRMLQFGTEAQRASVLAKIITDNVGEMNYALAGTDAGGINSARNAMADFREEVGKILQPLLSMWARLKNSIIKDFRDPILNAIKSIVNSLPSIMEGLLKLITFLTPFAVVWAGIWAVMNWPILAVVGSITLLIDLLGGASMAAGTAGKVIGGAIAGIRATFINLYNIISNIIKTIINMGASAVEFLVNTWKKFPTFLYTMLDKVMAIVEKVASGIDAIARRFHQESNLAGSIRESRSNLQNYIGTLQNNPFQLGRFEPKKLLNIFDEVKSGAVTGEQFEMKIRGYLENISKNTGKSAMAVNGSGNLDTEVQNEIKISDDYRDLLAEQATRQYQMNFATITPDFRIENMNISNEADVDNIIQRFISGLREATDSFLKGANT